MKITVTRRDLLLRAATISAAVYFGNVVARASTPTRIVKITARRFAYEPNVIELKQGEPVSIEIESLDFVHGMNIPALKTRLDLVPGRKNRFEFTPEKLGVIEFVCDNFCGDGHEEMHGQFVVVP